MSEVHQPEWDKKSVAGCGNTRSTTACSSMSVIANVVLLFCLWGIVTSWRKKSRSHNCFPHSCHSSSSLVEEGLAGEPRKMLKKKRMKTERKGDEKVHSTLSEAQQSTCKSQVSMSSLLQTLPIHSLLYLLDSQLELLHPSGLFGRHIAKFHWKNMEKCWEDCQSLVGQHMMSLAEAIGPPSLKRICLHFVAYDILWHFMNLMTSDLIATRPQWNEQSASPNASADQPWLPLEPCTSNNPDHGQCSVEMTQSDQ